MAISQGQVKIACVPWGHVKMLIDHLHNSANNIRKIGKSKNRNKCLKLNCS